MIVVVVIGDEVDSVWNVSHAEDARNKPNVFEFEWDALREKAIADKKARYTEGKADEEGHYTEDVLDAMADAGWKMEQTAGVDLVIVHD